VGESSLRSHHSPLTYSPSLTCEASKSTTRPLRDGTQGEGVSLSLQDKLQITQRLDELGVDFVEGGYPASNTKDAEYFQRATKLPLKSAKIAPLA